MFFASSRVARFTNVSQNKYRSCFWKSQESGTRHGKTKRRLLFIPAKMREETHFTHGGQCPAHADNDCRCCCPIGSRKIKVLGADRARSRGSLHFSQQVVVRRGTLQKVSYFLRDGRWKLHVVVVSRARPLSGDKSLMERLSLLTKLRSGLFAWTYKLLAFVRCWFLSSQTDRTKRCISCCSISFLLFFSLAPVMSLQPPSLPTKPLSCSSSLSLKVSAAGTRLSSGQPGPYGGWRDSRRLGGEILVASTV